MAVGKAIPVLAIGGVLLAAAAAEEEDPLNDRQISARIRKHRTAEVTLTVTDAAAKPLAKTPVTVEQVRHKFLFGSNAYMLGRCGKGELERAYRRRFSELLNFATLPFYWGAYEQKEHALAEKRLGEMARWCASRGIRTKGHPLCWHTVVPEWLPAKAPAEVESAQLARIARDVKAFAGRIDIWDVVNEAVVMPDYKRKGKSNPISRMCKRLGRVELIKRTFASARRANSKAVLLLNDYITSEKYPGLIRECLDAGIPIDVIGIQSHMHRRYWGATHAWAVCERFAKLGKPLHFTELTILSGRLKTDSDWYTRRKGWTTTPQGEKRQAKQVEELYRVLFSHPAVEAITWWDLSDHGAWQGAPAGLLREDMSPKPAYEALMRLIKKQWWTGELKRTTDDAGKVRFRGFLGSYRLAAPGGGAAFEVHKPGKAPLAVRVK